jgi:hypothetical protein
MHAALKSKSKLKFVTLDKESDMSIGHAVATRRDSENLQRGRSGEAGAGNGSDSAIQKKSRKTLQPQSSVLLRKLGMFLVQATRWGCNQ